MNVETCWGLVCFIPFDAEGYEKIFGFAEFLAALALLAVLYTVTDYRYKFRVAIAPGSMFGATFAIIAFIGIATLMTEVWAAQKWFVPQTIWLDSTTWQAGLGLLFLGTFLTWTYYAYIRPPVFGYRNAERYTGEIIRLALRGNEDEIKVGVSEVGFSAKQLVKHWSLAKRWMEEGSSEKTPPPKTSQLARDVFFTLSGHNICKVIVKSSPITVLQLFKEMGAASDKHFPMSAFSRNITMEAVSQTDSFLYGEAEGYQSGFFGYVKPVSQTLYGNYELVAAIQQAGRLGTFDVEGYRRWEEGQWSAYLRAVLITMKSFLATAYSDEYSQVLARAFESVNTAHMGLEKLSGMENPYETKVHGAFSAICDFATEGVELVNKASRLPRVLHVRRDKYPRNIHDQLADLMYQLCIDAAYVKGPFMTAWTFQHNLAWSTLHGFEKGPAWTVVRAKTRRLLCEEIDQMVKFPNYVSIRAIAFCLNLFGLEPRDRKNKNHRNGFVLSRKAQAWASEYYLTVVRDYPDLAEVMLIGSISFDKENSRLVQTNHYGMSKKPTYKYLDLKPGAVETPAAA